jgi:hypothetical protein
MLNIGYLSKRITQNAQGLTTHFVCFVFLSLFLKITAEQRHLLF